MLERQLEQKLRLAVKAKGGLALKLVSPGTAGVPDRIVLAPDGRVFFVELKALGGVFSPKQIKMAHTLSGLGHVVLVIDSPEKVQELVELL